MWNAETRKLMIRKCIDNCFNESHNEEEEKIYEESRECHGDVRMANIFYKKLMKIGGTPVLCGDCGCFSIIMPAKNDRKPYLVSILHLN
jgi:hypothetical protein